MEPLSNWFGLGMLGFAIIGLIFLWIGFRPETFPLLKLTKKQGAPAKIIGIIMVALVLLSYFGLLSSSPEETTVVDEEEADWMISVTEAMSHVTYNSVSKTFNVKMAFNDTSDAFTGNTQYLAANFTISNLAKEAVGKGIFDVGAVGTVDDEYVLDQNTDDSFKMKWTNAAGVDFWESGSVRVEAGDSTYLLVNITMNADAVALMNENESVEYTFYVCGIEYTVVCWKGTVTA